MSDPIKRDYSFTVRLSPEEKAALETLADRLDLDRSAAVRQALFLANHRTPLSLTASGRFVALHAGKQVFPVRLNGKASRD